jgi:hypothetical protein
MHFLRNYYPAGFDSFSPPPEIRCPNKKVKVVPLNLHHPPISDLCFEIKPDYTEKLKQLKNKKPIVPAKDNYFSSPPHSMLLLNQIRPKRSRFFWEIFTFFFAGRQKLRRETALQKHYK